MTAITKKDMLVAGGFLSFAILGGVYSAIIMKKAPIIFDQHRFFSNCCNRPNNHKECSNLRTEYHITNVTGYCLGYQENRGKIEFFDTLEITLVPFAFLLTCMSLGALFYFIYSKREAVVQMSNRCSRRREYQVLNAETENMPL